MSPARRSILSSFVLAAFVLGCGGGSSPPGGAPKPGKDMTGSGGAPAGGTAGAGTGGDTMKPMGAGGMKMAGAMPGKTPGMMPGTAGSSGIIVVGIPTPGMPPMVFPGGGPSGGAPLKPGCTPASARECPSSSGTCATSSSSSPTGTTTGTICFYGPISTTTTTTPAPHAATIEYLHETAGGQEYYRFRVTFDPAFVDNTYGVNAIGWPQKGHTFKDLVGSDHAELSLFDSGLKLTSMFDLDYITASSASACGYGALGVSGGEGKMLTGDAKYILGATTSLDRDLNGCGYCKSAACGGDCTVDSPATDASYTPNAAAPNWDYRVVYEVWVDAAVFAGKGFGGASITFVHASPSKASSNTVNVTPRPCGGGGCPEGQYAVQGETGATCTTGCPDGTYPLAGGQGASTCSPCPNGQLPVWGGESFNCTACPAGTVVKPYSEGYDCVDVGGGEGF